MKISGLIVQYILYLQKEVYGIIHFPLTTRTKYLQVQQEILASADGLLFQSQPCKAVDSFESNRTSKGSFVFKPSVSAFFFFFFTSITATTPVLCISFFLLFLDFLGF